MSHVMDASVSVLFCTSNELFSAVDLQVWFKINRDLKYSNVYLLWNLVVLEKSVYVLYTSK